MSGETKYKPNDRLDSIFARYGFWNGKSPKGVLYNSTLSNHCGGGCHGDGSCGGDGD